MATLKRHKTDQGDSNTVLLAYLCVRHRHPLLNTSYDFQSLFIIGHSELRLLTLAFELSLGVYEKAQR